MGDKTTSSLVDSALLRQALLNALQKLDPRIQWENPVMFVVLAGAVLTAIFTALNYNLFHLQLTLWLWFTILFANFAEAMAEGRGKAQAATLRKMRTSAIARRLNPDVDPKSLGVLPDPGEHRINASELQKGDIVICESNDIIPSDGEVIYGIASVDESAITGESAPVIRESGGDRSAVTGGTKVISDRILIRITSQPGNTFIDRMISMVEGANRQKTPNERALGTLLVSLTLLFILTVFTLPFFAHYSERAAGQEHAVNVSLPVLVALLVCLIPTTIGGLLSAIGISGIDRLVRRNVLATSGHAVEAAGDIDVLLLDKTGTITMGNRMAVAFHPAPGVEPAALAARAQVASLADETPEGRSIVILAKEKFNIRAREMHELKATFIPFTAQTRMSGVVLPAQDGIPAITIQKGAAQAVQNYVESLGGAFPEAVTTLVAEVCTRGATPLVVAEGNRILGVIELKDVVKGGIRERFAQLRHMGIRTVMITGDNALTAAAIAEEAGVDDFLAQATPEDKLRRIREEQANGHLVAMTGDGTNDAPALAQADVGVAMNTGTQAAREAGNMVDLDSNPTKLIEIVEIGKQLLMTRGALTTFSISNDVAKYFAILPAIFGPLYAPPGSPNGPLSALNIMGLHSPESAILSAVIFNALIIIGLIPLALSGVRYQAMAAKDVLLRNLIVYGGGGLLAPFIGIKLIDSLLVLLHLA